ncbi:hypothetical protein BDP67DRAFT_493845 [Colletotrichum lupini]|nr:hypothetical protein BDP67DRAFT_493845 [Colletotrichum lupini]
MNQRHEVAFGKAANSATTAISDFQFELLSSFPGRGTGVDDDDDGTTTTRWCLSVLRSASASSYTSSSPAGLTSDPPRGPWSARVCLTSTTPHTHLTGSQYMLRIVHYQLGCPSLDPGYDLHHGHAADTTVGVCHPCSSLPLMPTPRPTSLDSRSPTASLLPTALEDEAETTRRTDEEAGPSPPHLKSRL